MQILIARLCGAIAVAFTVALLCIGTTDTLFSPLFGTDKVQYDACRNCNQY
jgi:hypothetical protein